MTVSVIVALVGSGLLALVAQGTYAAVRGRLVPLGDEIEYLRRVDEVDPYAALPFLRVPGFIWIVRRCGGERWARRLMSLCSAAAVVLVAGAAGIGGGAGAAWTAGALFAFVPDRWVLAAHVWPDVLLSLLHAASAVLLAASLAGHAVHPAWFALVGTVAALIRVDAVVLVVVLAALPAVVGTMPREAAVAVLLVPVALSYVVVALVNQRHRGRFAIDDTLAFNLLVMEHEQLGPHTVQAAVAEALGEWDGAGGSGALRRVVGRLGNPATVLWAWCRRVVGMIGPDTFARDRMLLPQSSAPEMQPRARRAVRHLLTVSFPLLVGGTAAASVIDHPLPFQMAVPMVATFAGISMVHARTRYRQAMLPWMVIWSASSLECIAQDAELVPLLVAVAAAIAALSVPVRRESL